MANRTMCDVLQEMRMLYETRNFSPLLGLIEEAQSLGNRMESALYDKHDVEYYTEERSKLKKELKDLKRNIITLKQEVAELEELVEEDDTHDGF